MQPLSCLEYIQVLLVFLYLICFMGSEEPAVPGVTHPVFVRTLFAFVFEHGVPFSWNGSSSLALLLHKVENLFFTALSVLLQIKTENTYEFTCLVVYPLFHLAEKGNQEGKPTFLIQPQQFQSTCCQEVFEPNSNKQIQFNSKNKHLRGQRQNNENNKYRRFLISTCHRGPWQIYHNTKGRKTKRLEMILQSSDNIIQSIYSV